MSVKPTGVSLRSSFGKALAEEIIRNRGEEDVLIESEHALCKRFKISRVTVRLALSDLETRGLIYRRAGKGTYAYGTAHRLQRARCLALVFATHKALLPLHLELLRGFQSFCAEEGFLLKIFTRPPKDWTVDEFTDIRGVGIWPESVGPADLNILRDKNIPYLLLDETSLGGPCLKIAPDACASALAQNLPGGPLNNILVLAPPQDELGRFQHQFLSKFKNLTGCRIVSQPEMPELEEGLEEIVQTLLAQESDQNTIVTFRESVAVRAKLHLAKLSRRLAADPTVVIVKESLGSSDLGMDVTTATLNIFDAAKDAASKLEKSFITGRPMTDLQINSIIEMKRTEYSSTLVVAGV